MAQDKAGERGGQDEESSTTRETTVKETDTTKPADGTGQGTDEKTPGKDA